MNIYINIYSHGCTASSGGAPSCPLSTQWMGWRREARAFEKHLTSLLAVMWQRHYSNMVFFARAHVSRHRAWRHPEAARLTEQEGLAARMDQWRRS